MAYSEDASPHYEDVIRRARQALRPGGTLVVLDLKAPRNAQPWLIRLAALTARPFAVTPDLAGRHPWEIVEREFDAYRFDELYFDFSFIATGIVGKDEGSALPRARGR
jgi:SAM-dependent methyltransferase